MNPKRPRKQKTESLKDHALRLIDEIRKCPNGMCEHCQDVLFRELYEFLKTVEIQLPEKGEVESVKED